MNGQGPRLETRVQCWQYLTPERCRTLFEHGWAIVEIASAFEVSAPFIRRRLPEAGVCRIAPGPAPSPPAGVLKTAYLAGKSARTLAQEHGVSQPTALKWLREAGVPLATWGGQRMMRHRISKTGYRGVRNHGAKFKAVISKGGKDRHLGCFKTAREAARAYDRAARETFGAQAVLNFPKEGRRLLMRVVYQKGAGWVLSQGDEGFSVLQIVLPALTRYARRNDRRDEEGRRVIEFVVDEEDLAR